MSITGWFIVGLAGFLANAPFLNQRFFGMLPLSWVLANGRKRIGWRLLELMVLYFAVGALSFLLEARAGNVFVQSWPFYAVTFGFFLVLAFPGFVFCYLMKR
ncbi:DUF2818 family protein [Mycoavidus sp. B2-EB]|uniref:DUF2818 family protein n=1 Tax=Mycoavidus sp. B2-EB TaxID=2651972 RepID=UPI0016245138|nr:DUF2818 family protein [Mycoavidus sp. B2-EB]BBO60012.1 hypothetical protein MPB2EB_1147 [Mycoavidus sp. B2-EB]